MTASRDVRDVLGGGAAAAADDVDQARFGELAYQRRGLAGLLIVLAECVWQTGVWIDAHGNIGDARQLLDVRPQLPGTQCAVQTDDRRLGVTDRVPEGLDRLARERAPGGVGDRAGNHQRQIAAGRLEHAAHREQRRLGIERVEDGFDQQQIDAAFDQRGRSFAVGRDQLVEIDVAKARVVDARRQRGGAIGRPDGAGDEACPAGALGILIRDFARQARSMQVELADQTLHPIVAQRRGIGIEGVGLDDVGARGQVLGVNLADQRRLRQRQQVVVALQIARPVAEALPAVGGLVGLVALDHRAHGAVEHQDALGQQTPEFSHACRASHADCSSSSGGSVCAARTPSAWQIAKVRSARLSV